MDGLLHVSDLAWGRAPHPTSVVKPGEEIQVQILKFDKEKQRISLGRKQLLPDPWATVPERFPAGTRVHGKVVGVTDYGAFVQIEPGVEGLVHVSEMSWSKHVKHPSKIVKTDDEVDVVVLEVKTDQRRISLGTEATAARSLGSGGAKISGGHDGQRPHPQPGGVRRVCGTRRRHGRADPHQRRELDGADQASQREIQEGRNGRSESAESGFAEPPPVARHQADERHLGELVRGRTSSATS